MPLINASYFVGEINIPDTTKPAVLERLNAFIAKYEQRFLKEALGYELYKAFIDGLNDDPVEAIWANLLYGAEYDYQGRTYEWEGLIRLAPNSVATIDAADTYEYVPTSSGATMILPASFRNVPLVIDRRGYGQLRSDEFTSNGATLTLIGSQFNPNETFFIKKGMSIHIGTPTDEVPYSPIANYVYYWWMRDNVSKTASQGEVKPKGENSTTVSNSSKMARAWNEMVEQVRELAAFLDVNRSDYPLSGYVTQEIISSTYRGIHIGRPQLLTPINELNL